MLHLATTTDDFIINRQNKRKREETNMINNSSINISTNAEHENGSLGYEQFLKKMKNKSWQFLARTRNTYIIRGCRNVNGAFQESEGILLARSAESRSLWRLMHDLASYLAIRHKFSPGADLHNVRSVQRMHEWHAREGMQFVPTLAARFCTNTKKRRVVVSGARHTSRRKSRVKAWIGRSEGI